MKTVSLKKGINLHIIPDRKFKNFRAGVYFSSPLAKETAAKNALVARIMRSGTKTYPDKQSLNMRLDELYGASMYARVEKNGENHLVCVCIDALADRYIDGESIMGDVFSLLGEAVLTPSFASVEREKQALIDEIRGTINDKRRYALSRLIEEMCDGEAFGTPAYGREADVLKINDGDIKAYHKALIETAPVDIFVIGSFDEEGVLDECKKLAEMLCERESTYPESIKVAVRDSVKNVTDRQAVTQGKLVIGYRAAVSDADIYPLMVYNAVFGGGTSSKLFNNVREKLSLCYYASSMLYRKKGIILVQAGIDFEKYNKTLDEIINQSEDIKKGVVGKEEFEGAVLGIINGLRSCKDDLSQLMGYYSSHIGGAMDDIDYVTEKILSVKMEQITDVARQIDMDTIYFLSGNGTESDNEG